MVPLPLPRPPIDCDELHPTIVTETGTWFRVTGFDPCAYPPGGSALGRFDCPEDLDAAIHPAHYGVWYGADSELGAVCEKFGERYGLVTRALRTGKAVWPVVPTRILNLVDLRPPAVTGIYRPSPGIHLDLRLSGTEDYDLTQAWSACFHRCCPDIDGVLYRSRMGGGSSIALFEALVGLSVVDPLSAVDLDSATSEPLWQAFEEATRVPVEA